MSTCAVCHEEASLPAGEAWLCDRCAKALGRALVERPLVLADVWPALVEDDDEPEPRIRLDDGTFVELRTRTAALKEGLTLAERLELAETFGALDLRRERLLEAGYVLAAQGARELTVHALTILFAERDLDAASWRCVQTALYPC